MRQTGSLCLLRRTLVFTTLVGALSIFAGGCGDDAGSGTGPGSDDGNLNPLGPSGPTFGNADASSAMPGNLRGPDGGLLDSQGDDGDFVANIDPCKRIEVRNLDLLFIVDNSGSMHEEQEALRREFPKLVRALTSGDRDGDGELDFPPIESLHLGVVSSDMGLIGVAGIPNCDGLGGDGILRNTPNAAVVGCDSSYPSFLQYTAGADAPDKIADDFACIATLGTEGCGFEQQLEAGLKALWPGSDPDVSFLGDANGLGRLGHGEDVNAGFLRPVAGDDSSALGIILVTDEEDCSSLDTAHFTPKSFLDPADPLAMQDLNLRCFFNPQNLYPIERYVGAFQALRPGLEQLVFFGAIVGVPEDLVSRQVLASIDFADPGQLDTYYQTILDDMRMQEVEDPSAPPGNGSLTPSCSTESGRAFPPRRIVEVARRFGANSMVQSICQSDFGPAIDVIVGAIGRTVDRACIIE